MTTNHAHPHEEIVVIRCAALWRRLADGSGWGLVLNASQGSFASIRIADEEYARMKAGAAFNCTFAITPGLLPEPDQDEGGPPLDVEVS